MTEHPPKKYWFAAKRFGWGWGLPLTWQGWLVYGCYFLILTALAFLFPPHFARLEFLLSFTLSTLILLGICYRMGEPPRWRWGNKE